MPRSLRAALAVLSLLATALLGGCYYSPYGYYGYPAYSYARPAYVVAAPVYAGYGYGYWGRRW